MLSILCALAVLASGRPLTRENLIDMHRAAGENPPDKEIQELLLLYQVVIANLSQSSGHLKNADQDSSSVNLEIESLQNRVTLLEKRLHKLCDEQEIFQKKKDICKVDTVENPAEEEHQNGKVCSIVDIKDGTPSDEAQKISSSAQNDNYPQESRNKTARYLYGVIEYNNNIKLDQWGVEENHVYLIPADGLAAVVHRCSPEPYEGVKDERAISWIEAHNIVLEECMNKFPAVLPYTFNTILHDSSAEDADEVVVEWLKKEKDLLKNMLDKVRNHQEYGIQILWDPKHTAEELVRRDDELTAMQQEIKTKPQGTAYMYKDKLERLIKNRMESAAGDKYRELLSQIRPFCTDFKVEKNKKSEDKYEMIGNWSLLVQPDRVEALGSALEIIKNTQGYLVRFTGPWPPYSFVD